jgi:GTP cyclohydrolase I
MSVDGKRIEYAVRELLLSIGENPEREGLRDTPRRVAQAWREFIEYEPGRMHTHFTSVASGQMVGVSGMECWSFCEHHLLPFKVTVTAAYIPNKILLGLSKFGRIVAGAAHQLQVQERLTEQIANQLIGLTDTESVAVIARGEHICMAMRGVRMPAIMTTSVMFGAFQSDPLVRAEFLNLVGR